MLAGNGMEDSMEEQTVAAHPDGSTETKRRASTVEQGTVRSFGDYELLEEIARGAWHRLSGTAGELDRVVAVKMLLSGPLSSPELVKRFRARPRPRPACSIRTCGHSRGRRP